VHWVITRPMLERSGYLEEYVSFWNARPEVNRIWVSLYIRRFAANAGCTDSPRYGSLPDVRSRTKRTLPDNRIARAWAGNDPVHVNLAA